MDNSLSAYLTKYDTQGYGLQFPDGHVIRFYERILNFALQKTSGNLLDFDMVFEELEKRYDTNE